MKAIEWAFSVQGLSLAQKSVLVAIASQCGPGMWSVVVSAKRIATLTSAGRSTVASAVAALESLGVVIVSRRWAEDGSQLASRFVLCGGVHSVDAHGGDGVCEVRSPAGVRTTRGPHSEGRVRNATLGPHDTGTPAGEGCADVSTPALTGRVPLGAS